MGSQHDKSPVPGKCILMPRFELCTNPKKIAIDRHGSERRMCWKLGQDESNELRGRICEAAKVPSK